MRVMVLLEHDSQIDGRRLAVSNLPDVTDCTVSICLPVICRIHCATDYNTPGGEMLSNLRSSTFARRDCERAMAFETPFNARQGIILYLSQS